MKARIVRYGFIGVVAVLIILCGMKFSNMYKDYQKLQFNQEQIDILNFIEEIVKNGGDPYWTIDENQYRDFSKK